MNKKHIIYATAVVLIAAAVVALQILRSRPALDKHQTAMILADVYLLDAMIQAKGNMTGNKQRIVENAYHTVLERYGISKAEFDTIVNWYSANPAEYVEVYDDVVRIVSEKEATVTTLLNKRDSINDRIDSLCAAIRTDYWTSDKPIRLPIENDTVPKDLVYEYDADSLVGGKVTMKMDYVFPRRNESRDTCSMQLIVVYNDTIADTCRHRINRKPSQQKAELICSLRDTLPAIHLKATLLTSKELKKTTATLSNIKLSYSPYEITDSIEFDEILIPPVFSY